MIRYKLVDKNNNIIGITTELDLRYVQYNEDHSGIQLCKNSNYAFGISYNGNVYSLNEFETEYPYINLIIIGRTEYYQLQSLLNTSTEEIVDNYEKLNKVEDTSTLKFTISKKIKEMSQKCNEQIINGFDIILSDNVTYHFDLTIEDQLNLQSIQYQLIQGKTIIPFHCKNGEFKYYSNIDLQLILDKANNHILYNNSYFNCLKSYINSLSDLKIIENINYGINIPQKYKSEILMQIENK